jgi:hypothetical protein
MQQVLVSMYGVSNTDLQNFAAEVDNIKIQLREAYSEMKEKRDHLARELNVIRAKVSALKQQVLSVSDRIRRLKRKAEQDAERRAERLRKQLRERIRAHRAGLDFVKKLAAQVKDLRSTVQKKFGAAVAEIQTTLMEYSDDIEGWTGHDVSKDVEENKSIGINSRTGRLYTKRHLREIVTRMETKLRAAYASAKAALRRAKTGVPNPHVGRLEMLLNGLKARLSRLEEEDAEVATQLDKVENGHPSLRHLRSEFANVKSIVNQIYTMQRIRIPKVAPRRQHRCVKKVKKVHRHFNRCRKNLRKAVLDKAPKAQTYVLWKQYVVAKNVLQQNVRGCAKATEEMEMEDNQE